MLCFRFDESHAFQVGPRTQYVAETDFELLILLPLPLDCWMTGTHLVYAPLRAEPWALCMLDKRSVNGTTPRTGGSTSVKAQSKALRDQKIDVFSKLCPGTRATF